MPNLCENHFQQLRTKCKNAGLFGTDIDSVATSFRMVINHAVEAWPPLILEPETCVICFFNTKRDDEGRCLCGQEDCGGKDPGSVLPFESWLDRAVSGVRAFAITEGQITP